MRASLLHDSTGSSAIEFALLLPLLVLMLFGTVELHRYMLHKRHIEAAAKAVAIMIAQRPDPIGAADPPSMDFDLVRHMFPELGYEGATNAQWWRYMAFQVTHVVFKPTVAGCSSSCTYTANVAWAWPRITSDLPRGALERSCGVLTAAAPGATPSGSTLPGSLFGPGSMTIVDLQYRFTPLVGTAIVPAQTIVGQGFATSRFVTPYIANASVNDTLRCPGF